MIDLNEKPLCTIPRVMCWAVDNLELLLSQPDESIDLIYCDILYGTGRNFGDYQDLKPIRSEIEAHYLPRLKEMHRVLKPDKLAFIVIGDSVINKELIKIEKEISEFAPGIGFKVNKILSSDLSGHSRIFNPSYAQKGKKEHLITLQKVK